MSSFNDIKPPKVFHEKGADHPIFQVKDFLLNILKHHGFNEIDGPCVLEINTIPGLTSLSDLPAQAKEYGWSFPYLIEIILKSAIPRLSCQ